MPLPSFLKSKKPATRRPAAAADDSGPVQAARTQARRRLIGAVVLLALGVVGFPLIFETQPRPVALDIPIEVPARKDVASVAPQPQPVRPPAARPSAVVPAELPPEAADGSPASAPAAEPPPAPVVAKAPLLVASAPAADDPAPASAAKADDGSRAKALLEDGGAPKAERFVVQVGAYSDANALREARLKVEKLGLKTYTQVVETEAGKRTRVRVGPFASREEADSTSAKLKAAGLPAAILVL